MKKLAVCMVFYATVIFSVVDITAAEGQDRERQFLQTVEAVLDAKSVDLWSPDTRDIWADVAREILPECENMDDEQWREVLGMMEEYLAGWQPFVFSRMHIRQRESWKRNIKRGVLAYKDGNYPRWSDAERERLRSVTDDFLSMASEEVIGQLEEIEGVRATPGVARMIISYRERISSAGRKTGHVVSPDIIDDALTASGIMHEEFVRQFIYLQIMRSSADEPSGLLHHMGNPFWIREAPAGYPTQRLLDIDRELIRERFRSFLMSHVREGWFYYDGGIRPMYSHLVFDEMKAAEYPGDPNIDWVEIAFSEEGREEAE